MDHLMSAVLGLPCLVTLRLNQLRDGAENAGRLSTSVANASPPVDVVHELHTVIVQVCNIYSRGPTQHNIQF
jgi:hypothetical protein